MKHHTFRSAQTASGTYKHIYKMTATIDQHASLPNATTHQVNGYHKGQQSSIESTTTKISMNMFNTLRSKGSAP